MIIKDLSKNYKYISGRRIWIAAVAGALGMSMCGCGLVDMPVLTEEQTALVTEYAAGLLLKYDSEYDGDDSLLDDEELAKNEELEAQIRERERAAKAAAEDYLAKQANAKKDKNKDKKDSSENSDGDQAKSEPSEQTIDDLAGFFGMDGFNITYKGYSLSYSYPDSGEDMLMAMDATAGNQLCVLKYDVTNNSGSDATFDMFYRSPNFYLSVNGEPKVHQQYTLLLDDMAASNDVFAAGETQERVLIFEISDSVSGVDSMTLSAKNSEGAKGSVTLQ